MFEWLMSAWIGGVGVGRKSGEDVHGGGLRRRFSSQKRWNHSEADSHPWLTSPDKERNGSGSHVKELWLEGTTTGAPEEGTRVDASKRLFSLSTQDTKLDLLGLSFFNCQMGVLTATSLECSKGQFKNTMAWLTAMTQHHHCKHIVAASSLTSATPVIAQDAGGTQTNDPSQTQRKEGLREF